MNAESVNDQLSQEEASALIQILTERQLGGSDLPTVEDIAEAFSLEASAIERIRQEFADSRDIADFRRRVDLLEEQNVLLKRIVTDQSTKISGLHNLNKKLEKYSSESDVIVSSALHAMSRNAPEDDSVAKPESRISCGLITITSLPLIASLVYLLSRL